MYVAILASPLPNMRDNVWPTFPVKQALSVAAACPRQSVTSTHIGLNPPILKTFEFSRCHQALPVSKTTTFNDNFRGKKIVDTLLCFGEIVHTAYEHMFKLSRVSQTGRYKDKVSDENSCH